MPNEKDPQAVQSCHELIAWMIPQLDKFPRVRRFTLGERIETGLLSVLERLIEAAYGHTREQSLLRANLRLDTVRHLWRLSHELEILSTRQYGYGSRLLEDLGRQIGGWRRHVVTRQ